MARKKIQGNWGVLLSYVGRLYGNPANAIKEYISNALDEWAKAKARGEMQSPCEVAYSLEKSKITIDYNSPGMDEKEFKDALNRVAESIKVDSPVPQIGQLGIGIFAFNQVGNTCTFYSKKAKGKPTIKVVLMSNYDSYDIENANKRESRESPGMTIVITRLHQDPTKPRGSLAPQALDRFFAEKYDSYLREGNLRVSIGCEGKASQVRPLDISLPVVGEAFKEMPLSNDWYKKFRCQFWFDPTGKSRVSIRHTGVSIIEDLKTYPAYGLEESIYASGFLKGYIDADFLKPLPARTSFEENRDWVQFLMEMERMRSPLEDEINELRRQEEEKKLTEIQKRAIELARDILDQEQFKDLELLKGLRKRRSPAKLPEEAEKPPKPGKSDGARSKEAGDRPGGFRIAYQEMPFDDDVSKHSRFLSGVVQVNELHPDFRRDTDYGALMIGKEAIAYNDKAGGADYYLEKLLSYIFQVQAKARKESPKEKVKPLKTRKRRTKRTETDKKQLKLRLN